MATKSPLVVLWPNDWHDGIMAGIGIYEHQPVYFVADQWWNWDPISEEDVPKYSPAELATFSFEFGVYLRPVNRSFRLYQLTPRQFSQEELSMRLCHRIGPAWFRVPYPVNGILDPPICLEQWKETMGKRDYTQNPYVDLVDENDLIMPSSNRLNFKLYPNYWLYFQTVTAWTQTNGPLNLDWEAIEKWKLVSKSVLKYLARVALHRTPKEIAKLSYLELCQLDNELWYQRRRRLAKLAREAQTIGPMIMYQPGSRWVQPVMRDYFQPIPLKASSIHPAYDEILAVLTNPISRGYLVFLAHRFGLPSPYRSTPELCRQLRHHVELLMEGR
jgi:hypothetical protein